MQFLQPVRLSAALLAVLLLLLAASVQAGVKIKGSVEDLAEQADNAFVELNIDDADFSVSHASATGVGKAPSGARVTVSINHVAEEECEVSVSSASPEDPEIEQRFLRLMQSR